MLLFSDLVLHLCLTPGFPSERLHGEDCVALGTLLTHFHRLAVIHCCADIPIVVGYRHQGAEVYPSYLFVKEKANHVAV